MNELTIETDWTDRGNIVLFFGKAYSEDFLIPAKLLKKIKIIKYRASWYVYSRRRKYYFNTLANEYIMTNGKGDKNLMLFTYYLRNYHKYMLDLIDKYINLKDNFFIRNCKILTYADIGENYFLIMSEKMYPYLKNRGENSKYLEVIAIVNSETVENKRKKEKEIDELFNKCIGDING